MDEITLQSIAEAFGTPLYAFDTDEFAARATRVQQALIGVPLCYSMKANPFLLAELPDTFRWVEVCSPGELRICERLGLAPQRILYSGVNKGEEDIERAICDGVGLLTAESPLHLERIHRCAAQHNRVVNVLLRLTAGSQFGMDEPVLTELIARRAQYPAVRITGIHFFSGTQKRKASLIRDELSQLDAYLQRLQDELGFTAHQVEYGPGLAAEYFRAPYEERELKLLDDCAPFLRDFAQRYPLCVEMGRFFAAPCGVYLTRAVDAKCNRSVSYIICDGGMHQLRYDGQTMGMQAPPITVLGAQTRELLPQTLCGSLCTTADVLVRQAALPKIRIGDVIAFARCGAYSVMEGPAAFLSRETPRVVLRTGGTCRLARDFFYTDALNTCREPLVWR
ncbi:MAG: alanine racemase [Clostridiales bacterium]|nr:alanine racemase [Clostridiales bacterium]